MSKCNDLYSEHSASLLSSIFHFLFSHISFIFFFFFQIHSPFFRSLHFVQSVSSFQCCILWLADSCQRGRWRLAGFGDQICRVAFALAVLLARPLFHITQINQSQTSTSPCKFCLRGVGKGVMCSIEMYIRIPKINIKSELNCISDTIVYLYSMALALLVLAFLKTDVNRVFQNYTFDKFHQKTKTIGYWEDDIN